MNCKNCTGFGICATCEYSSNYYLDNGVCQYCNNSNNVFINMTDVGYPCVLCDLAHCTLCTSLSQCHTCDTANDYFLNPTTKLC